MGKIGVFFTHPLYYGGSNIMENTEQKKARINISLTDENLKDIRELAELANMNISEFIRNSVRVYGALKQETQNTKNKIYIGTDKKVDKEIILP
jgi:hypothetical protein